MRTEKCKANPPVGGKRHSERIFEGEVRNRARSVLLLDVMPLENCKTGVAQRLFQAAESLLHAARMEWTVEAMHWLLDVRFEEDKCRVEDKSVQRNLNMLRKLSLNLIRLFKQRTQSKKAFPHIMLDCLLDLYRLIDVISQN